MVTVITRRSGNILIRSPRIHSELMAVICDRKSLKRNSLCNTGEFSGRDPRISPNFRITLRKIPQNIENYPEKRTGMRESLEQFRVNSKGSLENARTMRIDLLLNAAQLL